MPTRSVFTSCMIFAGTFACGLPVPSRAADLDGPLTLSPAWHAIREMGATRDLKPIPAKPHYEHARHPFVTLRLSSTVVPVGDQISFEISSSIIGFGHFYVLSASGRAQVWMENVPIAAGRRLLFPTGGMSIEAAAPAGREDLMFIVTKSRIDGFFGRGTTRSPRLLPFGHEAFKQAVTAKFVDRPQREWGYARAAVRVVDSSFSGSAWSWGPSDSDAWAGQWERQ